MGAAQERQLGGRAAWLHAGQQLLRSGGVASVKIHALRGAAGLTTGSFYHHFGGMTEYLGALADAWGTQTPVHIAEVNHLPPRERILALVAFAPREDLHPLDRAMRDWAGSDERAAAAVRRVDAQLLSFLAAAFAELDMAETDARIAAQVLIASGVARIAPPWDRARGETARLVDMLIDGSVG